MSIDFCVSNLAWEQDSPAVFELLHRYGVTALELAPGKLWHNWSEVTAQDLANTRNYFTANGFKIRAFQAILFGHPELQVFQSSSHPQFLRHLETLARLAQGLGAQILVFGAPRNRRRNELGYAEALELATDFFRQAGAVVQKYGCELALEANPADYQCDFLTNTCDVKNFVHQVNSPGVQLHFDTGSTLLNHAAPLEILQQVPLPVHFHVSAPNLANVADFTADYATCFRYLKRQQYAGAISLEMKKGTPELPYLERALQYLREELNAAQI